MAARASGGDPAQRPAGTKRGGRVIGRVAVPGLVGWAVVMAILLAYQGLCLVRPNDQWPAFSDLLRVVMRYPAGRWVLFGLWLWSGWHFFVRGWRFFLRA